MKSRRAYGFGSSSGGQKDEVDATASYEDRLNYNLIYMKNKQELTQIQSQDIVPELESCVNVAVGGEFEEDVAVGGEFEEDH